MDLTILINQISHGQQKLYGLLLQRGIISKLCVTKCFNMEANAHQHISVILYNIASTQCFVS